MRQVIALSTILLFATANDIRASEPDKGPETLRLSDRFFNEMIEVLPGKWEGEYADGTFEQPAGAWTPTRVEYVPTAGNSALIENYLGEEGPPYMSTVYHRDNNDLRATHYCGAKNHPRMLARDMDVDERTVLFDFVDITNLKTVDSYHSRSLELRILSDDSIVLTYSGLENGEANSRVFRFRREHAKQ